MGAPKLDRLKRSSLTSQKQIHVANIGAIILAAGESARFGKPKQLIQVGGKSLIRRAVDAASRAGCSPIVIVVASDKDANRSTSRTEATVPNDGLIEAISRELKNTDVAIVENKHWQRGIGTSIRTGVQHLIDDTSEVDGIVLLVCDQPFVDAQTIHGLVALRQKTSKAIIASSYANTLGIPALFDRSCFQELLALPDTNGAKPVILENRHRVAEFPFPKGAIDIDTVQDLEKICSRGR